MTIQSCCLYFLSLSILSKFSISIASQKCNFILVFQGPVKIGKLLNHHLNLNQLKSELPPARRVKHFSRDVLKNRKKRRPKIWWKHLKYCLVLILRKLKMNSRGYIKKWWETLIRYLRMNKTISYCCSSNWRKLFIWWKYNVFYSYLIFVFKFFPEIKDMGFLIFRNYMEEDIDRNYLYCQWTKKRMQTLQNKIS